MATLDFQEEQIRRKAEEDKGGSRGSVYRPPSTSSAVNEERIRRKKEESKNGSGGGSAHQPHSASSAVDAFQENIRRKLERDGGSSGGNGGSEHGKEERGKARRKLKRENRSASMPIPSSSSAANEFEERIRRKMERGGGGGRGDNGVSDHCKAERAKARRKIQREDRSASMSISNSSSFEEKIRHKLERDGGGGHGKAKRGKARRKIQREDRSASMPIKGERVKSWGEDLCAPSLVDEPAEDNGNRRLARHTTRPRVLLASSSPDGSASLEVDEEREEFLAKELANGDAEAAGANGEVTNLNYSENHPLDQGSGVGVHASPTAVDKEACPEASGVRLGEIFTHLQRYKEQNGNLTMPASHPFFSHILNTLSSIGMEELLRKHWDQQLAGLRAFKERYGDCLVPEAHSTLGTWARIQGSHYAMYARRVSSPLTTERFNRLKDLGFDEFVKWAGSNKQEDQKDSKGFASSTLSEREKEEDSIDPCHPTFDQKFKRDKIQNGCKLGERALVAHHSSSPNKNGGDRSEGKAAIAEEMFQKRMQLQATCRGVGNEENGAEGSDGDPATSPVRGDNDTRPANLRRSFAGLRGSSTGLRGSFAFHLISSNLPPGSWECAKCTYINEPLGPGGEVKVCSACGAWECSRCTYANEGTSSHCIVCDAEEKEEGEGEESESYGLNSDSARSRDDSAIDSWTPARLEVIQKGVARPARRLSKSTPHSMQFSRRLSGVMDVMKKGKKDKSRGKRKKERKGERDLNPSRSTSHRSYSR